MSSTESSNNLNTSELARCLANMQRYPRDGEDDPIGLLEKAISELRRLRAQLQGPASLMAHQLLFAELEITKLSSAARFLKGYLNAHPEEDADIASFGGVTESHYERLGVTLKTLAHDATFSTKINQDLAQLGMKQKIDHFWDNRKFIHAEDFDFYAKTSNGGSDSLVRYFFLELKILYSEELDLDPLLLYNMNMNVGPEDPITISYNPEGAQKKCVTFVRGASTIAYVFFSQIGGSEFRQGQTSEEKKELSSLYPLTLETLVEDPKYRGLFEDNFFLQFAEYHKPIQSRIPQVIVECLAVMQKTNKKQVAWCLTTGLEWIFGIMSEGAERVCYLTDPVKTDDAKVLHDVSVTAAYWAMAPSQKILQLF
ncbi:hypothetical protein BDZ97DRAFT_1762479 [Flammula alnicola]|nr:hypothetical protein BDZ97DRAFT_1762479 [Flammula alnicola]